MPRKSNAQINRRQFILNSAVAAGAVAAGALGGCADIAKPLGLASRSFSIVADPNDPLASARPSQWAIEHGFAQKAVKSLDAVPPGQPCMVVAGKSSAWVRDMKPAISIPDGDEVVAIAPGKLGNRSVTLVTGNDARGLVYGLTELADAGELPVNKPIIERPANRVRSAMRMVVTDVEDKSWFNDREFWREYLSMLASQRFNRINLSLGLGYDAPSDLRDSYFFFAYPFFLSVPGYNVRATNLSDAERNHNLEMLRFITDESAARGLHFQLGLWTHAYVFTNSPNVNHRIEGLNDQTHGPYCRDALALLLKECPNINGVTFRIHGESGVPEGSYDFWKTVFHGCVKSGRRVELDMHAKGMDQQTIDIALATGLPTTISPKFWAEHMGLPYHQAGIRPTELPTRERGSGAFAQSNGARSFLRYGYGDLLSEDRKYGIIHRMWPGTQRLLLWGDPAFASAYGRASSFCGSLGCEIMEPLSFKGRKGSGLPGGRDGYLDHSLRAAGGDFAKYAYTYRLWGRMLYNPDTSPEVWQRSLKRDYASAAEPAGRALAHASRILPLFVTAHTPSAANNNYWPEMYYNMSIVDASRPQPYTDTPNPRRFGGVSPLDSQLFSRIEDYADDLLKGRMNGKYSPAEVAQWLDSLAQAAASQLAEAQSKTPSPTPAFRRFAIDVGAQAALGRFFASKLRAGILYAIYDRTGDRAALNEALSAYRTAREHWNQLTQLTKGVYVADVSYGSGNFQRGHWLDRLPAIDRDIDLMQQRGSAPATQPAVKVSSETVAAIIRAIKSRPERPQISVSHDSPPTFKRGQAIDLAMSISSGQAKSAQLLYRRTHQAQAWQSAPMQSTSGRYVATIPADYTNSPFPLTYYFELSDANGRTMIWPGFNPSLSNQPYYLLRQTT